MVSHTNASFTLLKFKLLEFELEYEDSNKYVIQPHTNSNLMFHTALINFTPKIIGFKLCITKRYNLVPVKGQ